MATVIHRRFTVDEYEQMIEKRILAENERVELIRGAIVEKMVIGPLHIACVNRLNHLLVKRLSEAVIVSVQNSIVLEDSELEPDVALLVPRDDFYATAKPRGSEVLLLIEVSESSLAYDREVKLPVYAQAGIQDYWIVNLNELKVEVYREPLASGSYSSRSDFSRGDVLSLLAIADANLLVDEIFG